MKAQPAHLRSRLLALLAGIVFATTAMAQAGASAALKLSNQTFELLKQVSELSAQKASIYLTITTHQDLAWIKSIEKSVIDRDTLWITPFLKRLRESPSFQMDAEQSSVIKEYINRHPDMKDTIARYMNQGRLLVGAAFTQAYEDMYSGESLARQFYFGKKWLKDNFNGYNTTVYYNSDVPGRTLQMPQLMAKAGVDGMFFSRFGRGIYNWYSPDGSYVTAYSPGHYIDFYNILAQNDTAALRSMAEEAIYWLKLYDTNTAAQMAIPAVLNYEFGWNQKPVRNLDHFMDFWNHLSTIENENGETFTLTLPQFHFSTFDKFIKVIKTAPAIPAISGERPNEWIYIHGPSHHWALSASRKADIILPEAEKFWSSALMLNNREPYPADALSKAWEAKVYPDHGWGGKDGQSTDDIFLSKFEYAREKGLWLRNSAMDLLSSQIKTRTDLGIPVVVFNSLSWPVSGPVSFPVGTELYSQSLELFNAKGESVPFQLSGAEYDSDGNLKKATVNFIASSVPSIGYDTYYLKPSENKTPRSDLRFSETYENAFYQIHFSDGGVDQIVDKASGKELLSNRGWKAGDIFTLQSIGNGAGEFGAIQQPSLDGFDKTSNYKTQWSMSEDGPVYSIFTCRQPIRDAVVVQSVKMYKTIKRIDFNVALKNWDGRLYREYRMALPLNIDKAKVSYQVPFGVVEIGKDELKKPAGQIYHTLPKDIHPRGMENWMNASGTDFGVTMSSSVAAFDFIDPRGDSAHSTLLQPILLASRISCNSEGNEYLQTGDHYYSFSLTSGKPGWQEGFRFGQQANEHLVAIVGPTESMHALLPEKGSFVSVDKENVIVSDVKKSEDDDGIVVRLYEIEGKDTDVDIHFKRPIEKAYRTDLIEENIAKIPVEGNTIKFHIKHNSIETIKVYFK